MVKFRAVTESDRPQIEEWIESDASHRGQMTADKFLVQGSTHALYAIGDEQGTVMYVRQEAEGSKTRMHVQFGPDRRRIMSTLLEAFPMVSKDAKNRGFTGVVFYSHSPALVKFFVSKLHARANCEVAL